MSFQRIQAKALVPLYIAVAIFATASNGRELLAPTPAPAPAPSPSSAYTVPNWRNGVQIANATLPVGGVLIIPWQGRHGVYQTASYACPTSYPDPNPNGQIAPVASGGNFQTTFNTTGTYYFVCQVGDHCNEGQLIAVTVS